MRPCEINILHSLLLKWNGKFYTTGKIFHPSILERFGDPKLGPRTVAFLRVNSMQIFRENIFIRLLMIRISHHLRCCSRSADVCGMVVQESNRTKKYQMYRTSSLAMEFVSFVAKHFLQSHLACFRVSCIVRRLAIPSKIGYFFEVWNDSVKQKLPSSPASHMEQLRCQVE